jgi:hypothetical protein
VRLVQDRPTNSSRRRRSRTGTGLSGVRLDPSRTRQRRVTLKTHQEEAVKGGSEREEPRDETPPKSRPIRYQPFAPPCSARSSGAPASLVMRDVRSKRLTQQNSSGAILDGSPHRKYWHVISSPSLRCSTGLLADAAPRLHRGGRGFDPCLAHQGIPTFLVFRSLRR